MAGQAPGKPPAQPFPTSTPVGVSQPGQPPGALVPVQPQPGQPAQPAPPPPPPPTFTPAPPPITPPTWTPLPTHTVTSTPTITPFPTFIPRVTPTLAWPTPGPSAFFLSRYMATALDPMLSLSAGGVLRGRVLDWRGIGLNAFRIQARGPVGQVETSTTADGQYTMINMAPGEYEVLLPDYGSEPAKGIPITAGNATTVDWQEASRSQGEPTRAPGSPTAPPTRTATPVPANLIQRPAASPSRPPPTQIEIVDIATRAIEQLVNWFLTGVAAVSLIAVVVIALTRRRR
ncbi:MAG TPA: carboxypeptidase-like regulatory domain-containing protein [Chloroflexota bacterium]